MTTTLNDVSRRIPHFRLLLFLALGLLIGCTQKQSEVTRTESHSADSNLSSPPAAGDELQLPSVPEVGLRRAESNESQRLPEEDEMDVRSPVQLKFIASSETVVRGVRIYIAGIDTTAKATIVHAFLQNLWGKGTRLHPEPISVNLTSEQLSRAKLLDDQTGRTYLSDAGIADSMDITRSADWKLGPGDRQTLVLAFPRVPRGSESAALIIPGFATVSAISLRR